MDAVTRLNAALDGRYRIERELGEGDMASGLPSRHRASIRSQAPYKIGLRPTSIG